MGTCLIAFGESKHLPSHLQVLLHATTRAVQAVKVGMEAVAELCQALMAWRDSVGKPVMEWAPGQREAQLQEATKRMLDQQLQQVYSQPRGE